MDVLILITAWALYCFPYLDKELCASLGFVENNIRKEDKCGEYYSSGVAVIRVYRCFIDVPFQEVTKERISEAVESRALFKIWLNGLKRIMGIERIGL